MKLTIDERIEYVKMVLEKKDYNESSCNRFNYMIRQSWKNHLDDLIEQKEKGLN